MRIDIGNGVRLFAEVTGYSHALTGDHRGVVKRPTVLLLHGGPGLDHMTYKGGLDSLADVAQVVMYDHRGQGRSDRRPVEEWTLDTWADDVVRLCDVLGIENPIVFGNSFGGMVAMHYLARHPQHPSKVVLSSTTPRMHLDAIEAMFAKLGGDEAAAIAARFWRAPDEQVSDDYLRICGPLYTQSAGNVFDRAPTVRVPEITHHFITTIQPSMDLRPGLARATCPVLVLAGDLDPVCPPIGSDEIAAALPAELVRYERFARSGHGVFRDEPERAMAVLREFIG
jgi:pimeloyl-ACP methyl ester carboxylesterase